MARPLRLCIPGASYHIFSRGNRKEPIFFSDRDRFVFIEKMNETCKKFGFVLFSFCLMPNHYHLYLQISRPNLSAGIHFLNASYSNWLKAKYQITGHVFQGRYKSILVDDSTYAVFLSAYIHMNPVKAKICDRPDQYRWSSCLDILGRRRDFIDCYNREFILRNLHENTERAVVLYERYLSSHGRKIDIEEHISHGLVLGNDEFLRKFKAEIAISGNRREISFELRKGLPPISLQQISEAVGRIFMSTSRNLGTGGLEAESDEVVSCALSDSDDCSVPKRRLSTRAEKQRRNVAIYLAKRHSSLTLGEIGKQWNLDYTSATHIASRLERQRKEDPFLDSLLRKAEKILGVRSCQKTP